MRICLLLVAALLCGCVEKKCAQLDYKHKDGSIGTSKKCFDINENIEVSTGTWRTQEIQPPAEQRRLAWLNEQSKEDVVTVTLSDEE